MVLPCDVYMRDWSFALAHGSELYYDDKVFYLDDANDAMPPGPNITRLMQIIENIQAHKETVIALVLDDPEFNKDPQAYLSIWETIDIPQTYAAVEARKYLKARMSTPTYWPQKHEMTASAIIEKIEREPAYKNDPKTYLKAWIDARESSIDSHPEEDAALKRFRQLWYIEDVYDSDFARWRKK